MGRPVFEYRLRHCPGEFRAVLTAFLVLAASALIVPVLAGDGSVMDPIDPDLLRKRYAGGKTRPVPMAEQVLEAADGPFNGTGSMRPAFTTRSAGWDALTRSMTTAEREKVTAERDGERLAILTWIRSGADRAAYDRDDFDAGAQLTGQPITAEFSPGPGRVRIRSLLENRCATCHSQDGREDRARLKPFDTYDRLQRVVAAPPDPMIPRETLARSTADRVTVLSLLFAATGILICFTGFPPGIRRIVAVLPLTGLAVAAASEWLARSDGEFVWGIVVGRIAMAVGLTLHVIAGLVELVRGDCGASDGNVTCRSPSPDGR